MNKAKVPNLDGKRLRIRPRPVGFDHDDLWVIRVCEKENLEVRNVRTSHFIKFGLDHMVEYRTDPESDGFLCLKSTLILRADHLELEPTLPWEQTSLAQAAKLDRRQEVRQALVEFHDSVYRLGWGGWPGVGAGATPAWHQELAVVSDLRKKVVQMLDIDRESAGREWCGEVEKCLEAGWKLVHFCLGYATGIEKVLKNDPLKLHDELRQTYLTAYRLVI